MAAELQELYKQFDEFDLFLSQQIIVLSLIIVVIFGVIKEVPIILCFSLVLSSDRCTHLRSMPPSSEALRHSGGDSLLFTSAMVTLYFEVELSSESRPGTEQNRSVGFTTHVPPAHRHNIAVINNITPQFDKKKKI